MGTLNRVRFETLALWIAVIFILVTPAQRAVAQTCTAPPSEALNLHLAGVSPTQLTWMPPADPGGTQTVVYDVLRSGVADGFVSADCIASGVPFLGIGDAAIPPHIFYYLVRAKNGCGGTLGTNSSGIPITGTECLVDNGGACLYDNECSGGACCSGSCTDVAIDPDHCGACANVCSTTNMATRTCSGGVCDGTCFAGYSNCDGTLLSNGCECAGNICCAGGCEPLHTNGLGQSFDSCEPSGNPGNPMNYSLTLALEARAAWPFAGSDSSGICGTGSQQAGAVMRQTATACAVWVYQKNLAGYVHLNTVGNTCLCPTNVDPTWY